MSQHTPGPWSVDVWNYAFLQRKELTIENKDVRIAVLDADMTGDNPFTVPLDVAQANARLMAAAPDLLAALEGLTAIVAEYRERVIKGEITGRLLEHDYAELAAARAAIRKATEDSTHA